MSTRLLAIILTTVVVVGIGLMAGAIMTEKKSLNPQTSNLEMPRGRVSISSVKLRWLLIKAIALLVIGIVLLTYGYSIANVVWRSIGYLSVFLGFTFLGGLLRQTNV